MRSSNLFISRLRPVFRRLRYGEPIIVVSGLPRSGTSMMMQMLEAGGLPIMTDELREADPSNPKGYYELERVKDLDKGGDTSWLANARGRAVKIVSSFLEHLPDRYQYKVIFMHRDLDEVLSSQAKMLERRGEASETDDDRMRELSERHLRRTKAFLAATPCFDVLEASYNETLTDPLDQARQIAAFLGDSCDAERMAGAVDSELYRNRRG